MLVVVGKDVRHDSENHNGNPHISGMFLNMISGLPPTLGQEDDGMEAFVVPVDSFCTFLNTYTHIPTGKDLLHKKHGFFVYSRTTKETIPCLLAKGRRKVSN